MVQWMHQYGVHDLSAVQKIALWQFNYMIVYETVAEVFLLVRLNIEA